MSRTPRIAVVTGSRAEYGLLEPVMRLLRDDPDMTLLVVATGSHLSPEHGLTRQEIEADGYEIHEAVEMLLSSDTSVAVAKSVGLGTIGFADAYRRLSPDLVVLLGDRFEIFAAAQAALFAKIPVAHLCGGDVTEGAFDESLRHGVTKMAHLHFVTNPLSAARVRQLGEDPAHVHCVGFTGLDRIRELARLDRRALQADLDFVFRRINFLVTFHPETLASQSPAEQFRELLDALDVLESSLGDVGVIFTLPNADTDGRAIARLIGEFTAGRGWAKAYASLGRLRYPSVMAQADVVVGNSSSGLYEAPSFGKPTVNIGGRQQGRLRAASVFDCPPKAAEIAATVRKALDTDCSGVVNPYGDGHAAKRIHAALKDFGDFSRLVRKRFHMVGADQPGEGAAI